MDLNNRDCSFSAEDPIPEESLSTEIWTLRMMETFSEEKLVK